MKHSWKWFCTLYGMVSPVNVLSRNPIPKQIRELVSKRRFNNEHQMNSSRHQWQTKLKWCKLLKKNNKRKVYLSPKSISIHILVVVTERCICKRSSFYIHVIQLSHVCSNNLIRINKYNLHMDTLMCVMQISNKYSHKWKNDAHIKTPIPSPKIEER